MVTERKYPWNEKTKEIPVVWQDKILRLKKEESLVREGKLIIRQKGSYHETRG